MLNYYLILLLLLIIIIIILFFLFLFVLPFRKPNIFDNMLSIMEKYAYNLEGLVQERTNLLYEEKKKTDMLLYQMLPR